MSDKSPQDLINEKVEEASKTRYAMLEGLAKLYCEQTGYDAWDVELVQQQKGDALTFYFRRKE